MAKKRRICTRDWGRQRGRVFAKTPAGLSRFWFQVSRIPEINCKARRSDEARFRLAVESNNGSGVGGVCKRVGSCWRIPVCAPAKFRKSHPVLISARGQPPVRACYQSRSHPTLTNYYRTSLHPGRYSEARPFGPTLELLWILRTLPHVPDRLHRSCAGCTCGDFSQRLAGPPGEDAQERSGAGVLAQLLQKDASPSRARPKTRGRARSGACSLTESSEGREPASGVAQALFPSPAWHARRKP